MKTTHIHYGLLGIFLVTCSMLTIGAVHHFHASPTDRTTVRTPPKESKASPFKAGAYTSHVGEKYKDRVYGCFAEKDAISVDNVLAKDGMLVARIEFDILKQEKKCQERAGVYLVKSEYQDKRLANKSALVQQIVFEGFRPRPLFVVIDPRGQIQETDI